MLVLQYVGEKYGNVCFNTTLEIFLKNIRGVDFGENAKNNNVVEMQGVDSNGNDYMYYEDTESDEGILIEVNESTIDCGLVSDNPTGGSDF
jgi:hypothetical protein